MWPFDITDINLFPVKLFPVKYSDVLMGYLHTYAHVSIHFGIT